MPGHVCDACGRIFKQKSHLDSHLAKKISCVELVSIPYSQEVANIEEEIDLQREMLAIERKQKTTRLKREGKEFSYPNQQEAAVSCIEHFRSGKSIVILVAQPGAGKTGVAQEVMYNMCIGTGDDNTKDIILTEQTVIVSGMSDTAWRGQFVKNMLPSFGKHVYHRSELDNKKQYLEHAKLLIDDECHIASAKDMTVGRVFNATGWLDIVSMEERGRKLLEISATPDAVSLDLEKWGDKAATVILEPGPDYKGFQVMLDEGRIRRAPNLSSYNAVLTLLKIWDQRFTTTTAKYFPMRLRKSAVKWVVEASEELGWLPPIHYNSESFIDDIDTQMRTAPVAHQIILLKEFWRASKRLVRDHVGGSYEASAQKRNTTCTAQGLTARFCDTYKYVGDYLNPDLRPLHFCDVTAITEYVNWFNNRGNFHTSPYSGSMIRSDGKGNVRAQQTKVHPTNTVGIEYIEEKVPQQTNYYVFRAYKDQGDAQKIARKIQRKYNMRSMKTSGEHEGYYVSSAGTGKAKPQTYAFVKDNLWKKAQKKSRDFASPCYLSLDDKESLLFVIVLDTREISAERIVEIDDEIPHQTPDTIEHI